MSGTEAAVAAEYEDFNAYQPNGEPAADRWVTAVHLFDEPGSVAETWERAQALFEAKDYTGAAKLLTVVVAEAPEQVAPSLLLARAYYHSAQLTRAEEQLRLVIDRCPVEHYAYLMLGRTLERQGRKDEAGPWLRAAEALSP
jgi:predicted Zn-dependent protease